jgi:anion-transporting  ArsA/GET3 family ATPase
MTQHLNEGLATRLRVIAKLKSGSEYEFISTAGNINNIINEFKNHPDSLKEMRDELTKKIDTVSSTAGEAEEMSEEQMNEFMDVFLRSIFLSKIITPEQITITVTNV